MIRADQEHQRQIAQRVGRQALTPGENRQQRHAADGPNGQKQPKAEKRQAADVVGNGEQGLQHNGVKLTRGCCRFRVVWFAGRLEQPVVD